MFAYRPAPIQATYLGYPGTTGADYIDYLLADAVMAPPDQQTMFSEQVIYLPHSYQVNDDRRQIAARIPSREECGLPPDSFVFCCLNNPSKIIPDIFESWMRILGACPGSVLWLLGRNHWATTNLTREAAARGVDPARIIFAPKLATAEHLARHRLADLFLDTLPYNAHTSASDALWAGLPVITCEDETFAGRVAASLLRAIELPELVTSSASDYETLACSLYQDRSRLTALRARLAHNRVTAPLFDTRRFARRMEAAYRQMWVQWVSEHRVASFSVASQDPLPEEPTGSDHSRPTSGARRPVT
jgi:protein O-GlcNAc transferase